MAAPAVVVSFIFGYLSADKYGVPMLENSCVAYLRVQLLNTSTIAFETMDLAKMFGDETLVTDCWKAIDSRAQEALNLESLY